MPPLKHKPEALPLQDCLSVSPRDKEEHTPKLACILTDISFLPLGVLLSAQRNNEKLYSLPPSGEPSRLSNSFSCNPTLQKEEGEIPSLRDGSSGLRTLLSNGTKTSEQRRTWRENSWVERQSQFENYISSREKQGKHKQNEPRQQPRGLSPLLESSPHP